MLPSPSSSQLKSPCHFSYFSLYSPCSTIPLSRATALFPPSSSASFYLSTYLFVCLSILFSTVTLHYILLKNWNWGPQVRENVWHLSLWIWITSFNIMVSSFIHLPVLFIFLQLVEFQSAYGPHLHYLVLYADPIS